MNILIWIIGVFIWTIIGLVTCIMSNKHNKTNLSWGWSYLGLLLAGFIILDILQNKYDKEYVDRNKW